MDNDGDDMADNYRGDGDAEACSAEDGGVANTIKEDDANTDHDETQFKNGTLCDVDSIKLTASVQFEDRVGFDCKETRDYTFTCEWDADGDKCGVPGRFRGSNKTGVADYLSCEVEKTS